MESRSALPAVVDRRYSVFAYTLSDQVPLYRAILRLFVESRSRFVPHLRPQDVADALRDTVGQEEIELALTHLCEWGNLRRSLDTTDAGPAENVYRQRFIFQITREGEAAERCLAQFDTAERDPEL